MAKESGLGMTVSVDDSGGTARAIGNDITSINWTMPSGIQDVTGINSSGMERLLLLGDLTFALTGVFNDAVAPSAHTTFKDYRTIVAGSVGRTVTLVHSGQTLAAEILFNDYSFNRGQDGSLIYSAPGSLASGTLPAWS